MNLTRTLALFFALATMSTPLALGAEKKSALIYFGTYTKDGVSKGIYRSALNLDTGQLSDPQVALAATPNPSFLAIHPSRPLLYWVYETGDEPSKARTVWSAMISPESGALRAFGTPRSSGGEAACHISVNPSGNSVLVANYTGGNVSSFPILEDGSLGERASFHQHEGSSITKRQSAPHAHSINVSPDGKFALAADLGLDKILIYKIDRETAKLTPNDPPFAETPKGGGPRHLSFHPSGKFVFSNNEISSSVTSYTFDSKTGALSQIETESTLPAEHKGNSTAECLVHPSGKFLYVSNRGHDSIAVFAIDQSSGELTRVEIEPTGGKVPRGFGIDPTGAYLVAANQKSNDVFAFRIDQKSGALEPSGTSISIPSPVNVRFFPAKAE